MPPPRCSPLPAQVISPNASPRETNNDCYDVPPKAIPLEQKHSLPYPIICGFSPSNKECDSYDIPRPLLNQNDLTPSSSASSLTADSLGSSNRSSLANMADYDIPKSHNRMVQLPIQDNLQPPHFKELPLEINSALDTLEQLQTETTSAISKLLSFVCSQWREKSKLEENIMEIKLSTIRLKTAVHDFAEFCEGALGNATKASDKNLANKLLPLVTNLRSADKLVTESTDKLQHLGWNLQLLSKIDDNRPYSFDELEQIISCSKHLIEDVKEIASFIQGNSTLLFKKELASNNKGQWGEDYDYVSLDSKEVAQQKHAEIRDALPQPLKKGFDNLVQSMNDMALHSKTLDPDEKQVLTFFASQVITYHQYLTQAIDVFLQTVEHNQPPKVFLAHGKFVVLSAHKLIHIGDAVHRNVTQPDIKIRALNCSNALSETLGTAVTKIKQAALHFPSVTAVQEMVDSIVDISHLAKDVKLCIIQSPLS